MDEQTQQRIETILATGIGTGLGRLVTNRLLKIEDLIPEQRGIKDDILRASIRAGTTAVSAVLASVITRRIARGRWGA
jgi:hypothetical protein